MFGKLDASVKSQVVFLRARNENDAVIIRLCFLLSSLVLKYDPTEPSLFRQRCVSHFPGA
jgi:hypothetical protein